MRIHVSGKVTGVVTGCECAGLWCMQRWVCVSFVYSLCKCEHKWMCLSALQDQWHGMAMRVIPWQSPRWVVFPFSTSCSYPFLKIWREKLGCYLKSCNMQSCFLIFGILFSFFGNRRLNSQNTRLYPLTGSMRLPATVRISWCNAWPGTQTQWKTGLMIMERTSLSFVTDWTLTIRPPKVKPLWCPLWCLREKRLK